jgi:lipoprotein-anchoring transpeptidase ErfK/SrfK
MLRSILLGAVLLLVALPAAASAATVRVNPPLPTPGETIRVSNERTWTVSARVRDVAVIRAEPSTSARTRGRLRLTTEDHYPEVYLVLQVHGDESGRQWVQVRIPGRPNGRMGWVRRDALHRYRATRWLVVVDRRRLAMTAFHNGKRRWRRPVGIGTRRTPTPAGHFWIRETIRVTRRDSPYWPYAMGTSNYSTLSEWPGGGVVGIHGDWNQPQLIPGRPSHGCIRLRDRDMVWLARHVPVGAPLRIR